MFSLPDLSALLAVEETGSIREAAARVHKTQSAISQALQRIEVEAGFALLDRTSYRATLTAQGKLFAKRARPLIRQSDELGSYARVIAQGVEDRVPIAVHGAIPAERWSSLLTTVTRDYPDTVIEIRSGEGDQPFRAMEDRGVDLALLLSPPSDRFGRAFEYCEIGAMTFVHVVRDDALRDGNEQEDLQRLPQILVADFEDDSDPSFGVAEGHRYWRVSNHVTKAALILQGFGWGAVPEDLVQEALVAGTLRHIGPAGTPHQTRRPIYLYRHRDRPSGPVASAIWKQAERR